MHKAAEMGKADVVRFLLERRADSNIQDQKGRTSLHARKDVFLVQSVMEMTQWSWPLAESRR